jgi:zinc protease
LADRFLPRLSFLALLAFAVPAVMAPVLATPWPKSDMPPDPAVTFGELPNGMRYAIQHNATPSGEVSMRLRIAAGSLQEDKDQRGLAHFLEHMAFRGSKNVADGEMKNSLERIGLSFGSDTNASTGQEETIYQFDLPRSDDISVNTALNLLREIGGNLSLDPAAAKTEAGVVLSELSLRDLPSFKAGQARLDFLFQDPRASQLANGDPDVIAKASIQRIRDFYNAYYRPDRATLIIVGDIDPAKLKDKITAVFGGWRGQGAGGRDPKLNIPLNRGLEVQTFDGKGVGNTISLVWTAKPEVKPETIATEKDGLIEEIALAVLNRRYRDVAVTPDRPFTRAGVSRGQEYQAVRMAALTVGYEPGQWSRALTEAEKMRLDILDKGVTQAELDRVLTEMRSSFEQRAKSAATRPSRGIVNAIIEEIGENDVYTSAARDLETYDADTRSLTVATVNKALRDAFEGGGPLIFASGETPVEGGADAVKAAFLAAEKADRSTVTAAQVAVKPWSYTNFGAPGTVVSTQTVADAGATYVRFANGVRLTVRPSKFSQNEIEVAVKIGNGRLDLPRDRATVAWAAGAFTGGGLKDFTATELQRSLTGRHYGAGLSIGEDGFVLGGGTTPEDLDLQMQVLAAYVTAPAFRPDAFERTRTAYAERLRQAGTNPQAVMGLKLAEVLHDGDKRWASATLEEVEAAKPEELRDLLQPVLEKGAIDVTIVGDVSLEKAIAAVAATFGALPPRSDARTVAAASNTTRFPASVTAPVRLVTTDQKEQEIVAVVWPTHGRFPDIQDDVTQSLLADILSDRLFEDLRGLGTVYVAQAGSSSSKVFDYGYIQALAQLQPSAAQTFHDKLAAIVADLQAGKLTDDELTRARTPALEELRKARESNAYWLSVLDDTQQHPEKLDLARKYEAALKAVTRADIQAAAKKYLSEPKALKLAVGPAS